MLVAWLTGLGGGVELRGVRIPTLSVAGTEYVQLHRIVAAMEGRMWRVDDRFLVVLPGTPVGREMVFAAESSVVVRDGVRVQLPARLRLDEEQLLVPALAVNGLFAGQEAARVRTVDTEVRGDTVMLRLGLEPGRRDSVRLAVSSRSSLELRLCLDAEPGLGLDEQLRLLSLTGGAGLLRAVGRDSGAGLSLLLAFRRPVSFRAVPRSDYVDVIAWPRVARGISRIVLDPGHGGKDPGARGRAGTEEKTLALDVARRVKTRLEAAGLEVVLTRDSDAYVSLADRAGLANRLKASIFISIHINSAPNRAACGVETYFLSEARTDWERAVAARENAALELDIVDSTATGKGALGTILADLAQNEYLLESSELAERIQEAVLPAARVKDRGVRQANFYVLRNSFMPAVLVECGFISNRSEETLLRRAAHREQLAAGIAHGVREFVRTYEEKRANGR